MYLVKKPIATAHKHLGTPNSVLFAVDTPIKKGLCYLFQCILFFHGLISYSLSYIWGNFLKENRKVWGWRKLSTIPARRISSSVAALLLDGSATNRDLGMTPFLPYSQSREKTDTRFCLNPSSNNHQEIPPEVQKRNGHCGN